MRTGYNGAAQEGLMHQQNGEEQSQLLQVVNSRLSKWSSKSQEEMGQVVFPIKIGPYRSYLCCFFLFIEGFSVCRFSSGRLFDWSLCGSSGKVQCRNFLLEPTWLQNSLSIFLPRIHLSIIFICVLLFNPLILTSC